MGVKLRAKTLIVATAVVTLSSAANAHHRHRMARARTLVRYSLVHGAFALGFELLPLRPLIATTAERPQLTPFQDGWNARFGS